MLWLILPECLSTLLLRMRAQSSLELKKVKGRDPLLKIVMPNSFLDLKLLILLVYKAILEEVKTCPEALAYKSKKRGESLYVGLRPLVEYQNIIDIKNTRRKRSVHGPHHRFDLAISNQFSNSSAKNFFCQTENERGERNPLSHSSNLYACSPH